MLQEAQSLQDRRLQLMGPQETRKRSISQGGALCWRRPAAKVLFQLIF